MFPCDSSFLWRGCYINTWQGLFPAPCSWEARASERHSRMCCPPGVLAGAGSGAGMGLAPLFPKATSSPAWPQSLRWPLVVDGPQAEGRAGSGVSWLLQPWCPGPWPGSAAGGSLSPQGSSARPVYGRGPGLSQPCSLCGLHHAGLGDLSQSCTGVEGPLPSVHPGGSGSPPLGLAWI